MKQWECAWARYKDEFLERIPMCEAQGRELFKFAYLIGHEEGGERESRPAYERGWNRGWADAWDASGGVLGEPS